MKVAVTALPAETAPTLFGPRMRTPASAATAASDSCSTRPSAPISE
jgi:hypothetical protein